MRAARIPVSASLVLLLFGAAAATPTEAPPDPRSADLQPAERLPLLLERVRLAHADLRTLEARFAQLKDSSLLIEPMEARGTFSYAAPDRVRWEYERPDPISMVIRGDEMTTWYQDIGQAERVHVGRHSQRIVEYLGAGSSVARLLEYFSVALVSHKDLREPYRLELTPRYARIAKRLREIVVWIHSDTFLPVRLRYVEADGDTTEYRFSDFRINSDLPASRFEIDLPAGVALREIDLGQRTAMR